MTSQPAGASRSSAETPPSPGAIAAVLFVALTGVIGAYGFTGGSTASAALATLMMVAIAVLSPPAALAAYVVAIPFDDVLIRGLGFGPFALWTPAVAAGLVVNVLSRPTSYGFPRAELILLLGLFGAFGAGAVSAGPALVPDIRAFVSIAQQFVILILFLSVIDTHAQALRWLFVGVIVSSLLALVVALATLGGYVRLALPGEDVRSLANALGLAAILGVAVIGINASESLRDHPLHGLSSKLAVAVVFLVTLALIVTVSRGVIGATALAILSMTLFFAVRDPAAARRIVLMTVLLAGVVALSAPFLDSFTGGWLTRRIGQTIAEGRGIAVRLELWASAFSGFEGMRWLVGVGPGHFRGFDSGMYPHSVFVSMLHSGGLLALIMLSLFVLWNLAKSVRGRIGWLRVPFVVFLLASFAVHGSIHSKSFWLTLLILYAIGRVSYTGADGGEISDVGHVSVQPARVR